MLTYGFQRLALIGSAGYQRAELPLDDSVSLIAPNNHGKTSLINALQFLLIIDRRKMDFGSHKIDSARRFYFPNNSAYILLEAFLPQSGSVVLGCVGKGVAYDYEYFAYKGELVLDDFRLDDNNTVTQPKLISHLAKKGRSVQRYSDSDFRDVIYGGTKRSKAASDFTVFKLENANDAPVFQQVLTKTLKLDKLKSSDVKEYLLKIFRREQANASIDFKQEWEKAFHEINIEREQYLAAERNLPLMQELEQKYERTLSLRGKILVCQPKINELLYNWHDHVTQQTEYFQQQKIHIQQQQTALRDNDHKMVREQEAFRSKLVEINKIEQQLQDFTSRFALIPDELYLKNQLKIAREAYEQQAALCVNVRRHSAQSLNHQRQEQNKKRVELEAQLNTLKSNLYLHLANILTKEELEQLNKVLSAQTMRAAPEHYQIDNEALKQWLSTCNSKRMRFPGLQVSLTELTPQHQQKTEQELLAELQEIEQKIKELDQLIDVSQQAKAAEEEKVRLEQAVKMCEQALKEYSEWQQLLSKADQRTKEKQAITENLQRIEEELNLAGQKNVELTNAFNNTEKTLAQLSAHNEKVKKLKENRIDEHATFTALAERPHYPYLSDQKWTLNDLPSQFDDYNFDCRELEAISKDFNQIISNLAQNGFNKYHMAQTQDEEIKSIINFSHCLDEEKKVLERRARTAIVTVTASLRELRSGLWALQSKMKEFNRLISGRQLSDLKTFKIDPVEEESLVNAINVLIQQAEQMDSGKSFELFDQACVLDNAELDKAKALLIQEGNARQGLKVSDLFRLEFVVAKRDQSEEAFEEIDSAASNGTVLMAKLVTGLAMLYLMQDKRHNMKTVCYLDEALALDTKNQANLIEISQQFGFSLIFASPAPLTTARYCVPIYQVKGKNYISRNSWQIFTPLEDKYTYQNAEIFS